VSYDHIIYKYNHKPMSRVIAPILARSLSRVAKGLATAKTQGALQKSRPSRRSRRRRNLQNPPSLIENMTAAPASYGVLTKIKEPMQRNTRSGGTIISHSELVLPNITFGPNVNFNVFGSFNINPGLVATFTWLSTVAQNYTSYRVISCILRYVPIAPTSTQGDIIIYPAYNPLLQAPTTEVTAVNNKDTVTCSVWKSFSLTLDPHAMTGLGPRKYVRTGQVQGDLKTYDIAKIFIATNNASSNSGAACGKLFIDYSFEFFEPNEVEDLLIQPTGTSYLYNGVLDTFSSGVWTALTWSTVFDPSDLITSTSAATLIPGAWIISYNWSCQDNAAETFTAEAQLWINGNPNGTQSYAKSVVVSPAFAGSCLSVNGQMVFVVQTGSTAQLTMRLRLTGATGTLQVLAGGGMSIAPA